MHASTAATLASQEATTPSPTSTSTATGGRSGPAKALFLMGAGVTVLALAAFTYFLAVPEGKGPPATPAAATAGPAPAAGAGLTIQGPGDVTVLTVTYEAGETSGWHSHRGIHAVAVLEGELVVYDANCFRTTYGPGNPYIGGQQLHLIRNETAAPVPMVVTYLNPVTTAQSPAVTTTPPSCAG